MTPAEQGLPAFSIDLTRLHRRTVTSFYSNLVTRPTGRAVRMGVERQLVELGQGAPCVSVLDFSQVHVLDYSCADEIVAKLLLRYSETDRPVDAYFIARGLQEHHLESVEAVLERRELLLVTEVGSGPMRLLGPCDDLSSRCWSLVVSQGRVAEREVLELCGLTVDEGRRVLAKLLSHRVIVGLPDGSVGPIPQVEDV